MVQHIAPTAFAVAAVRQCVAIHTRLVVQVFVAEVVLHSGRLHLRLIGRQDSLIAAQVACLELIVQVLRGVVEAPPCPNLSGARANQNLRERASGEAEVRTVAVVAPSNSGILYLKHRLQAVLARDGEVITELRQQVILARGDNLLAPCLRIGIALSGRLFQPVTLPIGRRHVEVGLQKHGLRRTFRGATEVRLGIQRRTLHGQESLRLFEVGENLRIYRTHRRAGLSPLRVVVQHLRYQRRTRKHTHKAEVIVRTQEIDLTQETIFQFGRPCVVVLKLKVWDIFQRQVAAPDTLIVRAIEVQQEVVLVGGAPVLHVVGVRHIRCVAATLQRVVRHHITYEPLGEIGIAILPHQRHIATRYILNSRIRRGVIVVQHGLTRLYLRQVVLAPRQQHHCRQQH